MISGGRIHDIIPDAGAFAIFKRDFQKFLSNPFVIIMTLFMPIMYLIIFGSAMGGSISHVPIAVVQDEPT